MAEKKPRAKIPKPNIDQLIEKVGEFICKGFGQRALSFHVAPFVLEELLGRKLTPKITDLFYQEMLNHGYMCIPCQMSMTFFHFSLLNSLRFMDEDMLDEWQNYDEEDEAPIEKHKLH